MESAPGVLSCIVYIIMMYAWRTSHVWTLIKATSRHGWLRQAETDVFHARQRLAWSPPGINPSPSGANAVSERRLSVFTVYSSCTCSLLNYHYPINYRFCLKLRRKTRCFNPSPPTPFPDWTCLGPTLSKKSWVNNSLLLWSEKISLVDEWISLDSNSSRMKIHYSASEISPGSLDIHSKRSDHWRHYPRSENRVNRVIFFREYR